MSKILIVDDDINALKLLGYTLRKAGFEVLVAQNGIEGIEKATTNIPDLVVTDLMMPKVDGYEVTRQIRANPATRHIPIIMLTAKSQVHDKVAGFEAGVNDYVTKPVMPAELIARIKAQLQSQVAAVIQSKAKIIGFVGAKGGVGLTTLMINLGILLQSSQKNVVLVDFQTSSGTVSQQLGLANNNNLLELLKMPASAINAETISRALISHSSGLKALPATHGVYARYQPLEPVQATAILKVVETVADYILVDLGTTVNRTMEAVLKINHQTCIVTEPTFLAMDLAKRVVQYLVDLQLMHANDGIVLYNRSPSAYSFTLEQVRTAFNMAVWGTVPPAPELAFQALQAKIPMVTLQPNHVTIQQIQSIIPMIV